MAAEARPTPPETRVAASARTHANALIARPPEPCSGPVRVPPGLPQSGAGCRRRPRQAARRPLRECRELGGAATGRALRLCRAPVRRRPPHERMSASGALWRACAPAPCGWSKAPIPAPGLRGRAAPARSLGRHARSASEFQARCQTVFPQDNATLVAHWRQLSRERLVVRPPERGGARSRASSPAFHLLIAAREDWAGHISVIEPGR